MKKLVTLLMGAALLLTASVQAQQIKGDFDKQTVWGKSGTIPDGWDASNVTQLTTLNFPAVYEGANRNATEGKSVKMINPFCALGLVGANAPAYITLGKTWVFADIGGMMTGSDKSDGGTIGGIEFKSRPDSIVGYFKRTLRSTEYKDSVEGKPSPVGPESAAIIAYLWKGTFKSETITGREGGMFDPGAYITTVQEDQDLCVLGKKVPSAGSTGQLIAKIDYKTDKLTEYKNWTRISLPFDYVSDEMPDKLNVVLSSANYYSRADIRMGNELSADDVRLIYNTKLKTLTLGGEVCPQFNEDVFNYELPYADRNKTLEAVPWGNSKIATVSYATKEETSTSVTKTITINSTSSVGAKTLTYTLIFRGDQANISLPANAPALVYGNEVTSFGFTSNSKAPYTYTFSKEGVLTFDANTGKLKTVGAGTVDVIAKQAGNELFSSAVSLPLTVTVAKAALTVSVKDAWCERGESISKKGNKCDYTFVYAGLKNGEIEPFLTTPIKVTSKAPKDPEAVGSLRDITLSGGIATNYDITYAPNQKLTVRKTKIGVYIDCAGGRFNSDQEGVKYHKISVPFGQETYSLSLMYFGLKYKETESILGTDIPKITCNISKTTSVGTECPVTLTFSKTEFENVILVNKIPADAALVVKKAPTITVEPIADKVYGDADFSLVVSAKRGTEDAAVEFDSDISSAASIFDGEVTIESAGKALIKVYVEEKGEYALLEKMVEFNVSKAPLTVAASDTTRNIGEENPVFRLNYTGFKNKDTEKTAKIFVTAPSASCVAVANSPVGEYDIVVTAGEAKNYEITPVNGKLTIINPTSIDSNEASSVKAYAADGIINVSGNETEEVLIYTAQGVLVGQYAASETAIQTNLNKGIYIVKIGNYTTRVAL